MIRYVQTNNQSADFYNLVGPFLGNRAVAKELGMPVWNDPHREWVVALSDGIPVACSSIEIVPGKDVGKLKSSWVNPDWRGKGIYKRLISVRLEIAKSLGLQYVSATVTDQSYGSLIRDGFIEVGKKGKYTIMRRSLYEGSY